MGSDVSLTISSAVVEPIVRAKIQSAIVEALGNQTQLIEKAVETVMGLKVCSEGTVSNYSSSNTIPWVEWQFGNAVRCAAKDAIVEFVASKKPDIQRSVEAAIISKKNGLAKAIVEGLEEATKSSRAIQVNLSLGQFIR